MIKNNDNNNNNQEERKEKMERIRFNKIMKRREEERKIKSSLKYKFQSLPKEGIFLQKCAFQESKVYSLGLLTLCRLKCLQAYARNSPPAREF